MIMLRTKIGGIKANAYIIRLRRHGRIFDPAYDIVLMKQKTRNRGSYVEKLGYFNPRFTERRWVFNGKRFAYWVRHGVYVHSTVKRYLSKMLH